MYSPRGLEITDAMAPRPVALVHAEAHATRLAAVQRERQIKRWTRAKKEALISGDLALLKRL